MGVVSSVCVTCLGVMWRFGVWRCVGRVSMRNQVTTVGEQDGSVGADVGVCFSCGSLDGGGCECRNGVFRCRCR